MLLPLDRLQTGSILNAPPGSLVIPPRAPFLGWVLASGGKKYVLHVTGDHAGEGFELGPNTIGSGLIIDGTRSEWILLQRRTWEAGGHFQAGADLSRWPSKRRRTTVRP